MSSIPVMPKETFLADYKQPDFLVERVALQFDLDASVTRVTSVLTMYKNPHGQKNECQLDGDELELVSVKLDGRPLQGNEYQRTDKSLPCS
ncbi:MAG: hypothetical protein MJK04_19640, partial [Psychrosphaera sp.]|nr:hypothetical protein [Psychrosphaera sp.]